MKVFTNIILFLALGIITVGVYTIGNQTINGIKTFGSFPITPSTPPTTDFQTANKISTVSLISLKNEYKI